MNDTTEIGTVPGAQDVRAYVTAVRAWLADLPAEEVEDLTAGMEADLAERAAESGERLGVLLGDPETYAAELRSAAGLPSRSVPAVPAREPGALAGALSSAREAGDEVFGRWPWLRELRATWWIGRGAALGWLVAEVSGTGRTLLLPAVGAAVSIWVGLVLRRKEPLTPPGRVAVAAANVLAAFALLPMLSAFTSGNNGSFVMDEGMPAYLPQVTANGEEVRNVYAYDAAGNRLDGVRLFDQLGRPLFVGLDPLMDGRYPDLPTRPEDGQPDVAADVFPLTWPGHDAWLESGSGWTPPLTLQTVPRYATTTPSPAATPTPGAGVSPSPSPSASPSASLSASPSASLSPSPSTSSTP